MDKLAYPPGYAQEIIHLESFQTYTFSNLTEKTITIRYRITTILKNILKCAPLFSIIVFIASVKSDHTRKGCICPYLSELVFPQTVILFGYNLTMFAR